MNLVIRKADENDFEEILSLIKEFSVFQKTPEKVSISLDQLIKDKNIFQCLIGVNEKEIIGFATYYFTYNSWSGKGLYLDDLYVKQFYRKHSAGKKLLDAVIDLAKRQHCNNVRWLVSGWNKDAINFYKNMGATIDEVDLNCNFKIT
ncbi:MAG: GNAT family N-acetyltransferase [Ginsengibacter sp.]